VCGIKEKGGTKERVEYMEIKNLPNGTLTMTNTTNNNNIIIMTIYGFLIFRTTAPYKFMLLRLTIIITTNYMAPECDHTATRAVENITEEQRDMVVLPPVADEPPDGI